MRKIVHFLLSGSFVLSLMISVSIAQPTLTGNGINPVIGESFSVVTSTYVDPGNSGANQTWDLSSMQNSGINTVSYISPSTTAVSGSFPNSNVASSSTQGVGNAFYKTSATVFQNCGVYNGTVVMSYSDPEDLLRFPCNYNNTYVDTWKTQFMSGGYTFHRRGASTVTADGYGTLITPNGTYTNVIRIHFEQNYLDSSVIGGNLSIQTYSNDEYFWYKEGTHTQLAYVYTLTYPGGVSQNGFYAAGSVGISEDPTIVSTTNIYPNPSSDKINLDFYLMNNQRIDIRVINITGEIMDIGKTMNGYQGQNNVSIDASDLPEGIYFTQILINGEAVATKRFVKLN